MRLRGDSGQVVPVMAVVFVLCVMVLFAVSVLGGRAADRARARTAADAAALAGASAGESEAELAARRNGATVERSASVGDQFEVRVRVGAAVATARARRGW